MKIPTLSAVAMSVLLLVGCGSKLPPIPPTSATLATADKDVKAGAATALGVLVSASKVVDQVSIIESQIRSTLPASADARLRAAIVKAAADGNTAVDKIRAGVTDWTQLKAIVDPFLAGINPLVDVIRSADHPIKDKLGALGDVLAAIAVFGMQMLAGGAGCCT